MAQMLSRLTKIAVEINFEVYMINQDPKKPAGRHVLAYTATVTLMFRKSKGEQCVCKVYDALNLLESEAISLQTI
ncbi:meiotic recombination protein dmc1 [Artemisia annua]|uniref:Meiotic recombination protein dmc1 n=1 Tax=Artemisia annua TaxID=35608 RepID=A0A2U1KRL2_ARTAN|nr:meiotic recombination protein dmc1 [Artemisia annua]